MPITSSNRRVNGLHHITAISGPAQENVDFYAGILGMHLVKRSVNQDDPGTYHLFYADKVGNPGTDMTFFDWPQTAPKRSLPARMSSVCTRKTARRWKASCRGSTRPVA